MPRATFVNLVAVAMLWAVIALLHSAEFASCYPLFFVPTALFALALYRRAYKVETATVWGGWGAGFSAGFVVVFAELVVTTLVIILGEALAIDILLSVWSSNRELSFWKNCTLEMK